MEETTASVEDATPTGQVRIKVLSAGPAGVALEVEAADRLFTQALLVGEEMHITLEARLVH